MVDAVPLLLIHFANFMTVSRALVFSCRRMLMPSCEQGQVVLYRKMLPDTAVAGHLPNTLGPTSSHSVYLFLDSRRLQRMQDSARLSPGVNLRCCLDWGLSMGR